MTTTATDSAATAIATPTRGHRQVEHTADLALELWAPTEVELLREGARAIVELLTEGATVPCQQMRKLELAVLDPEDRLVQWLGEVLFLAAVEGFLVADAELELDDDILRATVYGQQNATALLRTEIKAVTYHDLHLQYTPGRVSARVVCDV